MAAECIVGVLGQPRDLRERREPPSIGDVRCRGVLDRHQELGIGKLEQGEAGVALNVGGNANCAEDLAARGVDDPGVGVSELAEGVTREATHRTLLDAAGRQRVALFDDVQQIVDTGNELRFGVFRQNAVSAELDVLEDPVQDRPADEIGQRAGSGTWRSGQQHAPHGPRRVGWNGLGELRSHQPIRARSPVSTGAADLLSRGNSYGKPTVRAISRDLV